MDPKKPYQADNNREMTGRQKKIGEMTGRQKKIGQMTGRQKKKFPQNRLLDMPSASPGI